MPGKILKTVACHDGLTSEMLFHVYRPRLTRFHMRNRIAVSPITLSICSRALHNMCASGISSMFCLSRSCTADRRHLFYSLTVSGLQQQTDANKGRDDRPITIVRPLASLNEETALSAKAYKKNCAGCHLSLPPAIFCSFHLLLALAVVQIFHSASSR